MKVDIKRNKGIIIVLILLSIGTVCSMIYGKSNESENCIVAEDGMNEDMGEVEELGDTEKISEESSPIMVHIIGQVKNPGLVKLEKGKNRITDAIEKAGGITDKADLNKINLAYILEDAQKVYIPSIEDVEEENKYVIIENGNNLKGESSEGGESVNINTATQTELETLPGIGPSTALKIIDYREENGKFEKIEDIQNVKGIGNSRFEDIKEFIKVN